MQKEIMDAKMEQIHAVVNIAKSVAFGLQKRVEVGEMTQAQTIAEFGRIGNSMKFDGGNGYLSPE